MTTMEEKIELEEQRDIEEGRLPLPGETEEEMLKRAEAIEQARDREMQLKTEAAAATARLILSWLTTDQLVDFFKRSVIAGQEYLEQKREQLRLSRQGSKPDMDIIEGRSPRAWSSLVCDEIAWLLNERGDSQRLEPLREDQNEAVARKAALSLKP